MRTIRIPDVCCDWLQFQISDKLNEVSSTFVARNSTQTALKSLERDKKLQKKKKKKNGFKRGTV